MTKKTIVVLSAVFSLAVLSSCHHDTLEDRAEQIVRDYTERYCPTPVQDFTITDSITFDRQTRTFLYYYTLTGKADNAEIIGKSKVKLTKALIESLKENTSMKAFKDAGYKFHYIYRSKNTGKTLLEYTATPKDYQSKSEIEIPRQ